MSNDTFYAPFAGVAAAEDLDLLLTGDDFEPEVEVDTIALDAIPDAVLEVARLSEALNDLAAHLTAGGDAATAKGLKYDIRLAAEALMAFAAEVGA